MAKTGVTHTCNQTDVTSSNCNNVHGSPLPKLPFDPVNGRSLGFIQPVGAARSAGQCPVPALRCCAVHESPCPPLICMPCIGWLLLCERRRLERRSQTLPCRIPPSVSGAQLPCGASFPAMAGATLARLDEGVVGTEPASARTRHVGARRATPSGPSLEDPPR